MSIDTIPEANYLDGIQTNELNKGFDNGSSEEITEFNYNVEVNELGIHLNNASKIRFKQLKTKPPDALPRSDFSQLLHHLTLHKSLITLK